MLSWNKCRWCFTVLLAGLLGAAIAVPALAADEKTAEKVEKSAEEKPAEKVDPFVVPQGTAEELVQYIEKLAKERPTAESREALMEFLKKRSAAMVEAADKVLAGKPTAEQGKKAVTYKVGSLQMLQRLGDSEASKKIDAIPEQLEKAGLKDLLPEIRGVLLLSRLQQAQGMNKEDFAKVLNEVKAFLGEQKKLERDAVNLAMQAAMAAEQKDKELAVQAYSDFGKLLAKSDDKNLANAGAMMLGAARRVDLVGKEMTIQGKTLDGKEFDWSKYKGKVVLIDFFATWCGPCRAETPNVQKNYEAYHNKGFDVVTISLDHSREDLEKYLEEHKHPWTVLLEDPEARGTDKSMSTYYGVFGIPQMILVDKDGKVVTLTCRGKALGEQLEKLLGPPEEKATDEKPATEDEKPVVKKPGKKPTKTAKTPAKKTPKKPPVEE